MRTFAGDDAWHGFERDLRAGRITLREALEREAALVRLSRTEALAFLERHAPVDPTFAPFVRRAHAHGASVSVVSSGLRQIIGPALERASVDVPVFANDVVFDADGWKLTFLDDSANGHDKAARVRDARDAGLQTVYIGDGISDFDAALAADVRFAKAGRALERYCRDQGVAMTPFATFAEIDVVPAER
ncbi:hypothetical protein WPS_00530 [Vulcanimicrobium alpinum]|uniref:Phosphoserine phosphatase n=1 Tax=Vulcanimicrobium alpinum TaxID=3016050 RepID=A0AAN1XUX4_UNVUL|nr:hypothetical protein WPS_00530 [Vulcanimicrobium alpinum]